ncbi:MAG: helix-turn-helix domain-containing protein [Clostridia bacterium]|nr:helix-turn-helix domain-containing protein [Clostridia bacterium]MBR2413206.1 helix-turn-helix domain-containing protein [Clostridia bacterium]
MTHAYREIYLNNAQSALGDAFDYAVNICGIPGGEFVKLFVVSSVAVQMENGEPAFVAGKSGIEIAKEVVWETRHEELAMQPQNRFARSKEYWIGWAVAYYQWYSGRKYSDIFKVVSFDALEKMYYTLHEADISKFVQITDALVKEYFSETNLKRIRTAYGCSQSELAALSGVSLRSVQMYEQRKKDINKAGAETVFRLAKTLGCTVEDLIEK